MVLHLLRANKMPRSNGCILQIICINPRLGRFSFGRFLIGTKWVAKYRQLAQLVERHPDTMEVAGS